MNNTNKIYKYFSSFLNKNIVSTEKHNIAIAYSGGVDSAVLLHLFYKWKENNPKYSNIIIQPILFQHLNSSIDTEPTEHVNFCKKNCKEYGFELTVIPIDLSDDKYRKQSDESAGFLARKNYYNNSNFDCIFLAHHLDDQTETVLSQMFRGAGKAMSGMTEIEGNHYRPLLSFEKNDLREYIKENNLPYHEEALNYDNSFTRNFWRNEVIPKIKEHYPETNQKINLFAKKQRKNNSLLEELAYLDGLEDFLTNKTFVCDLNNNRFENLLKHYLKKQYNTSLSYNIWEEIEKRMFGKQGKPFILNIGDIELQFKKNKNKWNISSFETQKTNKPKF